MKVINSNTGQEFEWSKDKFFDRIYLMKDMYHNYETGEEDWDLPFVNCYSREADILWSIVSFVF